MTCFPLLSRAFPKYHLLLAFAVFVACANCTRSPSAPEIPTVSAMDLDEHPLNPFARPAKSTVLLFVSTECPISNRYAPELQRLASIFQPQGFQFWLVYPNADETADAVRKHRNDYHLSIPALRDPRHQLVHLARAQVTPEAAVFSSHFELIYRGRIDNRFPELGQQRAVVTEHDLEQILTDLSRSTTLPFRETTPVGCSIP